MNYEYTDKKKNASAVGECYQNTLFVQSCLVMSPVWSAPGHNHLNRIKQRCLVPGTKSHNSTTYWEPNKRYVDCILRVGPDSSHIVFIESITAADASSNTQSAVRVQVPLVVFCRRNILGEPPGACLPRCHSHSNVFILDSGGVCVSVCMWGDDMTAMPVSKLA